MNDLQCHALKVVAKAGNRLMRDNVFRYGTTARHVAVELELRSETGPSWARRTVADTRAAVNVLLALRRRGLVADVDGRWYTTEEGERELNQPERIQS